MAQYLDLADAVPRSPSVVRLVLTAVELALKAGVPSKQIILNYLSRLPNEAPVPPLQAPHAFALRVKPEAHVSRYDRLRDREDHHAA